MSVLASAIVIAAAAVSSAPAAVPTPKPLTLPAFGQNPFAPVTFGEQHPALLAAVQYLFLAAALLLIILMSMQTTKTEGLSGTIGGRAESAYRGRLGMSEQLSRLTTFVAGAFIVLAIAFFYITK